MQAARGASLNSSDPDPTSRPEASRKARIRSLTAFWVIAAVFVALDQWSKELALAELEGQGTKQLVGDWLGLTLVRNPGAAFSMGTSFTEVLSVVACVATGVVLWFSLRLRNTFWAVGLGFLLAGIVGNLIDRLTREPGVLQGHVIDFFKLPNWPVFNVADICINVAAVVIIIQTLRGIRLDGTRHDDEPEADPAPNVATATAEEKPVDE